MQREYCEFLISQNPINDNMFCDLEKNVPYTKQKFRAELQEAIRLYQAKEAKNKTSYIDCAAAMIDVTNEFFNYKNVFFGKKADAQMEQLILNTNERLDIEKNNLINHRQISYDNMYEIFNNICIMQGNAVIAIENNESVVSFVTQNIDMSSVVYILINHLTEHQKYGSHYQNEGNKGKVKAVTKLFTTGIELAGHGIKKGVDMINKGAATKRDVKLNYYLCLLIATNMRSRELGEEFGYEW